MSAAVPVPRVWVGCLCCYNSGRLVGEWVHAHDAQEVSLADVHRSLPGGPRADCEEVWCLDTDDMPVAREMGVDAASRWAELVDECEEHLRRAFYAWIDAQCLTEPPDDLDAFVESYQGSFDDVEDYARHWAEETNMMDGWPDQAQLYFDWCAFARDMAFDLTTVRDPEGGVFVFTNQ